MQALDRGRSNKSSIGNAMELGSALPIRAWLGDGLREEPFMKSIIISAGLLAAVGCAASATSVTPHTANATAKTAAAIAAAETAVLRESGECDQIGALGR